VLEQQILKLNYKTFTQVVILGSATFVPFMQLPTTQRREVIEDILDIKVFSVMNTILKDKSSLVRENIKQIENEIVNHKNKLVAQKKLIGVLEASRQSVIDGIQSKVDANNQQIDITRQQISQLNDQMEAIQSKAVTSQITDAVTSAGKMKVKLSTNIESCYHTIGFFNDNTTCPTCSQHIAKDHKQQVLDDINVKITTHQNKLDQVDAALVKLTKQLDTANEYANQLRDFSIEISTLTNQIKLLSDQNVDMQKEIQTTTEDVVNLTEEKNKMRQLAEDAIELVENKSELLELRQLHDVASALLKDTGIKTAIIREYLPVMNKLINRYLAAMDFFVKFDLDESFQEVIKSRGRDAFTYDSFSEGEKRRLDLAILFTWRQIAKMKNSVNTNLLILDEILDGALDGAGIDYFLSIMNEFGDNTNVFVISHREIVDKFDAMIKVEKKNDFSVMVIE